ncbi:uncharacterized protein C2845_PM16G01840 [Panicum miliaceum]|uniref:Uncharacterized protein n=1 Tax=Panicum miliaceum TaxID=4540 RepID=A0A3L6PZC8_PANMI|nr:uncharacterized protein C2845_PM16G01840 [Panicum miliaceum]
MERSVGSDSSASVTASNEELFAISWEGKEMLQFKVVEWFECQPRIHPILASKETRPGYETGLPKEAFIPFQAYFGFEDWDFAMEDSSGSSPSPAILRNRYWILRHGRSVPNESGLIVSSLENGTKPEFGLAPQGFEQARDAGELLQKELEEMGVPVDSVKILYSPFSRTTETARVVAGVLGIPFEECILLFGRLMKRLLQAVMGLRECYFGPSYELHSHDKYAEVWAVDEAHPHMAPEGGESVADVANRLSAVLSSTETDFHSSEILIVSHGDPLQIFQAVLSGAKENTSFLDGVRDLKVKGTAVASVLSQHQQDEDCASADMVGLGLAHDIFRVQSRPCRPIPAGKMFKSS